MLGVERSAFSALITSRVRGKRCFGGWVAQLAEQWTENPRVGGSIPPPATALEVRDQKSAVRRRTAKTISYSIRNAAIGFTRARSTAN